MLLSLHLRLLLNLALACALTGLIWLVQVVQYPGLMLVGQAEFGRYHSAHTRRMGYVVAAPMVLELALATWLAWAAYPVWGAGLALAQLALVVVWLATFLLAVPFNNRLAAHGQCHVVGGQYFLRLGIRSFAFDGLTRTNWLCTLAWTARALLLGWLASNR